MTPALVAPGPGPRERTYRGLLRLVRFLLHVCTRRTQVGTDHLPASGAVIVVGALLRKAGYVPVHRRSADPAAALAPARAALEAGQCVGLYPEGAITRLPDAWPARAKTGVVRLALDTGAPVVPLAQWGTHRFVGEEGTRWRALLAELVLLRGEPAPVWAGRIPNPPKPQ